MEREGEGEIGSGGGKGRGRGRGRMWEREIQETAVEKINDK